MGWGWGDQKVAYNASPREIQIYVIKNLICRILKLCEIDGKYDKMPTRNDKLNVNKSSKSHKTVLNIHINLWQA